MGIQNQRVITSHATALSPLTAVSLCQPRGGGWGLLFWLLQSHSQIVGMELPISESPQGFSENPDATFSSIFILVGVPVRLRFNMQLFLNEKKRGYFAPTSASCMQ